jgi:hypothetical protein
MGFSFSNHLNMFSPNLPQGLFSTETSESLGEIGSLFPFDITSDFGFESHLGNKEADCDFFLQIKKNSTGAAILAGTSQVSALSPILLSQPLWQKITLLFNTWTTTSSHLSQEVEGLWLEFDHRDSSYNLAPNIFFKISEDNSSDRTAQWGTSIHVLNEIYNILFDIPFPDNTGDSLKRCFNALPEGAGIFQIGFMIPRQKEAVRLVIVNMIPDDLEKYLKEISWTGEIDVVKDLIKSFSDKFNYFVYNLNIGENIHPFLGIEMFFNSKVQPGFNDQWNVAFDFLESEKLLSHEKREALIAFCGVRNVPHIYPIRYISGISHLKLVCKRNKPTECKGYFGTMIR